MEVYGEVVPMWLFRTLMAITPFYISFSFLQQHLADKSLTGEGHSFVLYAVLIACREDLLVFNAAVHSTYLY